MTDAQAKQQQLQHHGSDKDYEAVVFLPHFRFGLEKGLQAGARQEYSWITKFVGVVAGVGAGYQFGGSARVRFPVMRVPITIFGCMAGAGLGKEIAEPCATIGIKIGKTITYSLDGLKIDLLGTPQGKQEWEKEKKMGRFRKAATHPAGVDVDKNYQELQANRPAAGLGMIITSNAQEKATPPPPPPPPPPPLSSISQQTPSPPSPSATPNAHTVNSSTDNRNSDLEVRGYVKKLLDLRREEAMLTFERKQRSLSEARRGELAKELERLRAEKARIKEVVRTRFGLSLSTEAQTKLRALAQQLVDCRIRERSIHNTLATLPPRHSDRGPLLQELRDIKAVKGRLKIEATHTYGCKLSAAATRIQ